MTLQWNPTSTANVSVRLAKGEESGKVIDFVVGFLFEAVGGTFGRCAGRLFRAAFKVEGTRSRGRGGRIGTRRRESRRGSEFDLLFEGVVGVGGFGRDAFEIAIGRVAC